jgi:cathepsin L
LAFAAISTIESAIKIAGSNLVPLSEQQVIDYMRTGASKGFHGGSVMEAFDFIATNGACSKESYSYMGSDNGNCRACTKLSSIAGFEIVSAYNGNALLIIVSRQPVSVRIDSYGRDFQHYHSVSSPAHAALTWIVSSSDMGQRRSGRHKVLYHEEFVEQ